MYYPQPAPTKTSGISVASLVLGIATLVIPFAGIATGPLSLVLGVYGRREVAQSRGRITGGGMATAGLITGGIGCGAYVFILVLPAVFA